MALPTLSRLVPGQTGDYFTNIQKVEDIGVVCVLLNLTRSFSRNFWTNIHDPRISFNGIIEQTNLNVNLQAAGLNVIYIPAYVPTTDARYAASDEALLAEYTSMLKLLNPAFDERWIKEWHVFRPPHAQAIFDTDFARRMPAHRSPIRGLYVTDSTQFYPEDRTISAAIDRPAGRGTDRARLSRAMTLVAVSCAVCGGTEFDPVFPRDDRRPGPEPRCLLLVVAAPGRPPRHRTLPPLRPGPQQPPDRTPPWPASTRPWSTPCMRPRTTIVAARRQTTWRWSPRITQ